MTDPTESQGIVDECVEEKSDNVVGGEHGPRCRQTEAEKDEIYIDDIGHKFEDVDVEGFGAWEGKGITSTTPHEL